MSEPDPSGYGDSPDTSDAARVQPQTAVDGEPDATLTTDEDAQRDDSVMRPGNEPD